MICDQHLRWAVEGASPPSPVATPPGIFEKQRQGGVSDG